MSARKIIVLAKGNYRSYNSYFADSSVMDMGSTIGNRFGTPLVSLILALAYMGFHLLWGRGQRFLFRGLLAHRGAKHDIKPMTHTGGSRRTQNFRARSTPGTLQVDNTRF